MVEVSDVVEEEDAGRAGVAQGLEGSAAGAGGEDHGLGESDMARAEHSAYDKGMVQKAHSGAVVHGGWRCEAPMRLLMRRSSEGGAVVRGSADDDWAVRLRFSKLSPLSSLAAFALSFF